MSKKVILGITAFNHDASACLILNDKIVAFSEEERFNHVKHTGNFPTGAINYCLQKGKISSQDITDVTFYFNPLRCFKSYLKHSNPLFWLKDPSVFKRKRFYYELVWLLSFTNKIRSIKRILKKDHLKIHPVDHHLAHAWYGYYASNFNNCVVISNDSVGEDICSLALRFSRSKKRLLVEKVFEQKDPHSIGYLYGAITELLGYKRGSDDGKIMALAGFGKERYLKYFLNSVEFLDNGKFKLKDNLVLERSFQPKGQRLTDEFIKKFGPFRKSNESFKQQHYDLVYALQRIVEKIICRQVASIKDQNVVLTGGVGQNSVANGKISNLFPKKKIFIPPIPNDAGCSLGSALYFYYQVNNCLPNFTESAFLGENFSKNEVKTILKNNQIKYREINNPTEFVAKVLAQGKVIAVFRREMECGPRALGHRSILANPEKKQMKDHLNNCIKYRENFRPYGGIILDKDVKRVLDYKNEYIGGKYMSFVYKVKPKWRPKMRALTHVDNTCRIQILKKNEDPFIESIIQSFAKITGIPIILNTSFNLRGYPICRTPREALSTFYASGLDYLLLDENILVSK
ncbi:MAG: hypothetical protein JW991_01515 [Candidatus Pacebacteria bacterium]|nr:hypothetical protein [Candidatus Paceibacterota bacterium]